MTAETTPKPHSCPNCGATDGFNARGVRFFYDTRSEMGTLEVTQTLRGRIVTWECGTCQMLIEVWVDAK